MTLRTFLKSQEGEAHVRHLNPEYDYKDLSQRSRGRSSLQTFFDESVPSDQLNGRKKFKVGTFLPIIDTLSVHLKQRLNLLSSVWFLLAPEISELRQRCIEFTEIYYQDVNEKELKMECLI